MDLNKISDSINFYSKQDFVGLSKSLNSTSKRIHFENWLLNHIHPVSFNFAWNSRVVTLICKKIHQDAGLTPKDQRKEDRLLANLISKAEIAVRKKEESKEESIRRIVFLIRDLTGVKFNFSRIYVRMKNKNLNLTANVLLDGVSEHQYFKTLVHQAIQQNNLSLLQMLENKAPKNLKAALKMQDKGKKTLIHLAISKNNLEILKLLAKAAPKEFRIALQTQDRKGRTPLHIAAQKGHIETLKFFIEKAPKASNILSFNGRSILSTLKQHRPKNYRQITRLFKNHVLLRDIHKTLLYRKALGHALHISGDTSLMKRETKEVLATSRLAGHSSPEWFHLMGKQFKKFKQSYPHLFDKTQINLLEQLFDLGANNASYSTETKIKRIKAGLPTLVKAGYKGHAVNVLIWGNRFVICNRGGASRNPIEVYHFNPSQLNHFNLLSIERTNQFGTKQDYKNLFFEELPKQLNFLKTKLDRQMEQANPLPKQIMGNCTFVSPITGIYAFLLISHVKEIDKEGLFIKQKSEKRDVAFEKAISSYQIWLSNLQLSILEKNIHPLKNEDSIFEPDHKLILESLRKVHMLPLDQASQMKLDLLIRVYLRSLKPQKRTEVKADIVYWKSLPREPLL